MLKLKSYSFSGIGRFVEKQTVDLDSRSHLIQIDGENTNTGGSSGAGKSTTVEALAFLLGISDIPSTQLQSRITKSPIWVQGEFEGGITITRSKKDGLTVETPDGTVSGNSKLAEERLDEIIGVDRKLSKTMCYKRQKQGGFFLNLTPKESHEFLVECLDLRQYQDKINTMNDNLKEQYKPRKIELSSSVEEIKHTINQLNDYLAQKEKPVKSVLNNTWTEEELEANLLVSQKLMENQDTIHLQSIAELGPKPVKPVPQVFSKEEDIKIILSDIDAIKAVMHSNITINQDGIQQKTQALYTIQKKIDEANSIKLKMIENQQDIDEAIEKWEHLKAGKCPTCRRSWDEYEHNSKEASTSIENLSIKQSEYRAEVEKIPHYKMMQEKASELLEKNKVAKVNVKEEEVLNAMQVKLAGLLKERQSLDSDLREKYLEDLNEYNQKLATIDALNMKEVGEIVSQSSEWNILLSKIKMSRESYDRALETYNKDVKAISDKLDLFKADLSNKEAELLDIERNVLLSEESIRLIKNYTLQKFQDTLNYVGHRASEIINMIPNMSNSIISFENAKQTKTGSIKNEVNAVINLEGDIKVPIKTLSGGERTSADFAVDLAIGEMIETMTQKGVNFLIIDEGFDGLDSISKIECLEILKTLNTNKKILMVDHSSEVKEMVHDIIRVKRINEESVIV